MFCKPNKENTKLLFFDKDGTELGYCPFVAVEDYVFTIPEDTQKDIVKLIIRNGKRNRTINLKPGDISDLKTLMSALAGSMCCVAPEFQYEVQKRLLFQINSKIENDLIVYQHKNLGYYEFNGQPLFFSDRTEIAPNIYSDCTRENVGSFRDGSEDVYHEMLETYVYPSTELSLAFLIGLSAITSGMLFEKTSIGCPIYVFSGKSSSGKTLAASLAISAFMSCNPTSSVLMTKLNSTRLGLTAQLQNIASLPVCFDDAKNNFHGDIAEEVYSLASGTPRATSNVNNEAVVRAGWRCSIIMTTETSILDDVDRRAGMLVRLIDLNAIQWTKSAEECDSIYEIITNNYGWIGFKLGEFISKKGIDKVYADYKKCKDYIQNLMKTHDALSIRVSSKYASICLTGVYYNKLFGKKFDLTKILKLLLQNESKLVRKRDTALDCYHCAYDFYKKHIRQFKGNHTENYSGVFYGEVKSIRGTEIVSISFTELDNIMIKAKFPQYRNYFDEWEKKGLAKIIKTNSAKLGRHVDFYFHFLEEEEMDDSSDDNLEKSQDKFQEILDNDMGLNLSNEE